MSPSIEDRAAKVRASLVDRIAKIDAGQKYFHDDVDVTASIREELEADIASMDRAIAERKSHEQR
jgi:hypothetical protein